MRELCTRPTQQIPSLWVWLERSRQESDSSNAHLPLIMLIAAKDVLHDIVVRAEL